MLQSTYPCSGAPKGVYIKATCPRLVKACRSLPTVRDKRLRRYNATVDPPPHLENVKVGKPKSHDDPSNCSAPAATGLSTEQQRAAETVHSAVRVKAGPGTGKTRVVIGRAHHLIATHGVQPHRILIITFTNKAAHEIVERLEAAGYGSSGAAAAGSDPSASAGSPGVLAKTFHGLGVHILRRALQQVSGYGVNARFKIMDAEQSEVLFRKAVLEVEETSTLPLHVPTAPSPPLSLPALLPQQQPKARPRSSRKPTSASAAFSDWDLPPRPESAPHLEPLTASDVSTLVARLASLVPDLKISLSHLGRHNEAEAVRVASENGLASIPDAPAVSERRVGWSGHSNAVQARWFKGRVQEYFSAYQRLLQANNALDFSDLICLPVRIFDESGAVRQHWQGRFDHILVDEFQDVDPAQYRMVKQLKGHSVGLFVVGDPDQAIYGWRGARAENMGENFIADFKDAQTYGLSVNYRSVPQAVEAADAVLRFQGTPELYVKQTSARPPAQHSVLSYHVYDDPVQEAKHIAQKIGGWARRGELGSGSTGPRWSQVGVLYRNRNLSRTLEEAFTLAGLPYIVLGGQPFWQYKEIKIILAYLHVVLGPCDSDVFLEQVINTPKRGIGDAAVAALRKAAQAAALTLGQLLFDDFTAKPARPAIRGTAASTAAVDPPPQCFVAAPSPEISPDSPLKSVKISKAALLGVQDLRRTVFVARSLAANGAPVDFVLRAVLLLSGLQAELESLQAEGAGRAAPGKRKSADDEAAERLERLATLHDLAKSPESWIEADDLALNLFGADTMVSEPASALSASGAQPDAARAGMDGGDWGQTGVKASGRCDLGLEGVARFLEHIALVTGLDTDGKGDLNAVRLMTIHASKGLEFESIFIVGLEEGILPSPRSHDMSEEKRLFYVGLTRGKDRLFLSRCKERVQFGTKTNHQVSSLLAPLRLQPQVVTR